jgi:hypothetical protein
MNKYALVRQLDAPWGVARLSTGSSNCHRNSDPSDNFPFVFDDSAGEVPMSTFWTLASVPPTRTLAAVLISSRALFKVRIIPPTSMDVRTFLSISEDQTILTDLYSFQTVPTALVPSVAHTLASPSAHSSMASKSSTKTAAAPIVPSFPVSTLQPNTP